MKYFNPITYLQQDVIKKNMPNLAVIFITPLSSHSSSSNLERAFSSTGMMTRGLRSSTTADNFERDTMLARNMHLIEYAQEDETMKKMPASTREDARKRKLQFDNPLSAKVRRLHHRHDAITSRKAHRKGSHQSVPSHANDDAVISDDEDDFIVSDDDTDEEI